MQKILLAVLGLIIIAAVVLGIEVQIAKGGIRLDFHNPPQQPVRLGQGAPLTYVVLGDSTAAGEGASSYSQGISDMTAHFLARSRSVTYVNLAISGARTHDVLASQVDKAAAYKPDVVLIAIGANDVTHLPDSQKIEHDMQTIIDRLVAANCNTKIVLTGSPDMGAVPRLPQPLRELAGIETSRLNKTFTKVVADRNLTFAPIAAKTGPAFRRNPDLFARDKYHPNDHGYQLWEPVLENALTTALANQPSHCR